MATGLADRLLAMLRREMAEFDRAVKEDNPSDDPAPVSAKARFETIAQMTKTLEKLLDLKRLERLAAETGEGSDAAETRRLRTELIRSLRALDAKRVKGAGTPFAETSSGAAT